MDVRQLFQNLKKEAECPLCLETVKDPKTLPCLHSFCLLCLDKHAGYARRQLQTTIKCPVCLACFQIPEGDTFGGLPTSFHLNRLVDVLALGEDSPEPQNCSSCEEGNTATCYCFDCSDFFCDGCSKVHNQMKISRHHRNVTINNLKAQDVEELMHRPVMCGEKYHERETLEYYCQDCNVCICHKCVILNHNRHAMVDIQEAAEEQKMQITEVLEEAKTKIDHFENMMAQETVQLKKSKEEIQAARNKVRTTIEELIHGLKEHETEMIAKLDNFDKERQRCHTVQQDRVQLLVTQLTSSVEYCEALLQRNLSFEILQAQQTLIQRCKSLLTEDKVTVKKPSLVNYVTNEKNVSDMRCTVPGQVVVSYSDASRSVAEGTGLEEAEIGREANFTITTKDSEGNQCYYERDQLAVSIEDRFFGGKVENVIKDNKDGEYSVAYTVSTAGEYSMEITLNDKPLAGSPWRVQGSPHQYKSVFQFGTFRFGQGIAVSNISGAVAVTNYDNYGVQLFSSNGTLIKEHVFEKHDGKPTSVAFTKSGNIIVVHARRISLFNEEFKFIKRIINDRVKSPRRVSVACDDKMIAIDMYDKAIYVLSPDGTEVLLSFTAPECDENPSLAVYHQYLFFVSYYGVHCVKVFNKEGEFLYEIGGEGSGHERLHQPLDLAIDKYNNLIVCDGGDHKIKVFTLNGIFVNLIGQHLPDLQPGSVTASRNGYVFVDYDVFRGYVEAFL